MPNEPFGPTGEFPRGKIHESDEGALNIGVANNGKEVIINFGTPIVWVGMPVEEATQFANIILKHVKQITDGLQSDNSATD
jgi:hypothetical protein